MSVSCQPNARFTIVGQSDKACGKPSTKNLVEHLSVPTKSVGTLLTTMFLRYGQNQLHIYAFPYAVGAKKIGVLKHWFSANLQH